MSILSHTHPGWCDPRLCATDHGGIDHRADPIAWSVTDHRVTVGRSRYDEILRSGEQLIGADRVTLYVESEHCLTPGGEIIAVELDLPNGDARMLAAALGQVAECISADYRAAR